MLKLSNGGFRSETAFSLRFQKGDGRYVAVSVSKVKRTKMQRLHMPAPFIQGGPTGCLTHTSITTPCVPTLKKLLCLELSRSSNGYFKNHFWIHVAVSEVKRPKIITVLCNGHSPTDESTHWSVTLI
jgi:hypothetical protein